MVQVSSTLKGPHGTSIQEYIDIKYTATIQCCVTLIAEIQDIPLL